MPVAYAHSLRQRLALIFLPSLAVLLAVSAIAQYVLAVRPMESAFDRAMIDAAIAISEHVELDDKGEIVFSLPSEAETLIKADNLDRVWYAVFDPRRDPFAGTRGFTLPPGRIKRGEPLLYDDTFGGEPVRAAALAVACGGADCTVLVAETLHKRNRLARSTLIAALAPVMVLGLLAGALAWFGIGRGLLPLTALSQEIGRRSPRDLREIEIARTPAEALPLVQAVNRLLHQLGESGRAQQRFLATAAHQLRTPLAGLQSRIELALLEARDEATRRSLAEIHDSAMRAGRLAVQLLSLARAEPEARSADPAEETDLARLAGALADEWVPRAIDRQLDLGFELQPAPVLGQALLLREMVINLLHNAIEYTQAGGRITLRTGMREGAAFVEVEDNGPGVPPEMREHVLERFVRLPASRGAGSGLGLAIVREIVDAHQARLVLSEGPNGEGLRASVIFRSQ